MSAGLHPITAVYGASPNFTGSTSAVLSQSVTVPPTLYVHRLPVADGDGRDAFGADLLAHRQLRVGDADEVEAPERGGHVPLGSRDDSRFLQAVAYTGGACSGQATGQVTLLYKPTTGATGGSTFRFDAGSNQFIFNWDTSSVAGPGCYELELQLNDGSAIKATIEKLQ